MLRAVAALRIEPLSSIASRSETIPGSTEPLPSKSILSVNLAIVCAPALAVVIVLPNLRSSFAVLPIFVNWPGLLELGKPRAGIRKPVELRQSVRMECVLRLALPCRPVRIDGEDACCELRGVVGFMRRDDESQAISRQLLQP